MRRTHSRMNKTIILISGGTSVAEMLKDRGEYLLHCFSDISQALAFSEIGSVDLAAICSDLPDSNGLSVLQTLKEKFSFPIIMLTDSEPERIAGLMLGADDVVSKSLSAFELSARIRALLRRGRRSDHESPAETEPSEIIIGGLYINTITHKCHMDGEEIWLTPLEFSILWYLCVRRGRVVPAEELFEAVWGEKYLDSAGTVMPHIARLRKKLHEPPKSPKYLKTVWGVGYTVDS